MSLEDVIRRRRTIREFTGAPLTTEEISQLCWAGQGITEPELGYRASPSAGALYPIELFVVTAEGIDRYVPTDGRFERHLTGDLRRALQRASLDQACVGEAGASLVIAAVVERMARKYGRRAEQYCFIEAGHVAQNILLQATALDLGGVPIGAFADEKVATLLKLPRDQRVLYMVSVGHPRG
jgi:SagB-type dehydrogenase family enzyme